MEYKKGVQGGKTFVPNLGMIEINEDNKQLIFKSGQLNLFKNSSNYIPNPEQL
jgi:hypothetical protein